jgi:MFS family permease
MGAPAGSLLGTGAMTLVSLLPERQFLAWGWRLPFLASVLLVSVGLFVRLRVEESPLFQRLGTSVRQRRVPVAEVLTRHPGKLVLGILVSLSQVIISGMASVWAVNYAVARGAGKTSVLNSATLASLALLLALLVSARLSDRIGVKPIIVAGIIAQVLFVYPMLMLVRSGSLAGFAVAVVIMYTIQGVITGPLGAFLADLFPAAVRFTGASLCFQGSATLGAGLAPLAAVALVDVAGGGISLVGVVWIAVLGVCLLAACLTVASRPRDRAPEREPSPTTLTSDT